MTAFVAVRIRGSRRVRSTIEDSMKSLRLTRANHCVVLPATPEVKGQLLNAKDYITFGTIDAQEIASLIRTRGRLEGDEPITDEVVAKNWKFKSIDELAQAIARGEAQYSKLPGVKPIFRLAPPRKGHKGGTKRNVKAGGALGDRGPAMADLLKRMI